MKENGIEPRKHPMGKDQEELRPWHRYQVVKACWPAIVDEVEPGPNFRPLRVAEKLDFKEMHRTSKNGVAMSLRTNGAIKPLALAVCHSDPG